MESDDQHILIARLVHLTTPLFRDLERHARKRNMATKALIHNILYEGNLKLNQDDQINSKPVSDSGKNEQSSRFAG